MQMIYSRNIPFIDVQSLAPRQAREALFRDANGFILYLSDG
jgi:predicted nuclease of restriction endonuclease-like RecB superfamily